MARASTGVAITALIGNAGLAAAKYLVAAVSGSGAVFAEAVHSTVDTGNQALLLLGIQRSERPAAASQQFGRSREIHFWSLVLAILLFALGAGVTLAKGLDKIEAQVPLRHAGWIYALLLGALLFQVGSWVVTWRQLGGPAAGRPLPSGLRKAEDPALFPLIFADTAAIAGLLVALAGVFGADRLGWLWADGAATLGIGALLALAALLLALETRGLLVGPAAAPHLIEDILGVAGRAPFVHGVNEVRTMQLGPSDILVNLSVDARDQISAGEVERGIAALEAELRQRHPEITRVFVELQAAPDPPDPG